MNVKIIIIYYIHPSYSTLPFCLSSQNEWLGEEHRILLSVAVLLAKAVTKFRPVALHIIWGDINCGCVIAEIRQGVNEIFASLLRGQNGS
jgi:hypothetical protein